MVAVLARARELAADAWPRVLLTWVDERRVPQADAASNIGAARVAGVLAAPHALHVLPLVRDDELPAPAQACARVATALAREFAGGLDVTLLGMGEDAHIASLFPGLRWQAGDAPVFALDDAPKPPPGRITLTRRFIATAGTHIVYVAGEAKRAAIVRVLAADPTAPLTGLAGVQLFTDQRVEPASIDTQLTTDTRS